ncbi:MAG: chromate transporter [Kiritimatiellia bacterium]
MANIEKSQTEEFSPAYLSMSRRKVLWTLFIEYFKISLFIVGGGYAIIIAADDVFGRKLKWLKEGELIDRLPIIQMVPGLIAGNSAIYVGLKTAGIWGVLVSLLAVSLPSFCIITAIAIGYEALPLDNRFVQGAFLGLRSAISGVILATILKSWPRIMRGAYAFAALAATVLLILVWKYNVGLVLVGAMLVGILWRAVLLPLSRRLGWSGNGGEGGVS